MSGPGDSAFVAQLLLAVLLPQSVFPSEAKPACRTQGNLLVSNAFGMSAPVQKSP
jgi:hypothetical protein